MKQEKLSFDNLPFSSLFKTYVSNYEELNEFYSSNPFSFDSIKNHVDAISDTDVNRSDLISAIKKFHGKIGIDQSQQLNKLSDEKALVIVTGQQLGIYGGPLFTIYKTATAISLAKNLEIKLDRPVVPVFWLADEDHDFEEVTGFGIPGNEKLIKLSYTGSGGRKPVSDEVLDDNLNTLKADIKEELFDTDFSEELWNSFDSFFKKGATFRQAFAQMMDRLFGSSGLLISGSHDSGVKSLLSGTLKKSLTDNDEINDLLVKQSDKIGAKFHQQVTIGDSNLFWIDSEGNRIKIERNETGWIAGNTHWREEDLVELVEEKPECFSPNVFLRPIIQDKLLPTLGYVAGPGEVAYYAQMKTLYQHFGLEMPVIFPRMSATLIESGVERIIEKLPFELHKYGERIEDLEKEYAKLSEEADVEKIFSNWKEQINNASHQPREVISDIDGSLDGMVGKTISGFENELNKLKGRVYRSIKQQEQTQLQRIRKIKAQVFPDEGLQERTISFLYFMNKYGIDIWDKMIDELEEDIDLQHHHIFYL